MARTRSHLWLVVVVALVTALTHSPASAQSLSTADLAGLWSVHQLSTPITGVTGDSVRSFTGIFVFDDAGGVTGNLTGNSNDYDVTGTLAVSTAGLVSGTLALDAGFGATGTMVIREARIFVNKHTIVGAATLLGQVGLFTFVKLEDQTFTLDGDLAGDWNYHEVTPVTDFDNGNDASRIDNEATWSTGSITFHDTASGNPFCTEADLTFAGGKVRSIRTSDPQSFG